MIAIILAAGRSLRYGSNKLLLQINGKYLIESLFETIKFSNFEKVVVVQKDKKIEILAKHFGFCCEKNLDFEKGQSESVRIGIKSAGFSDSFMFFVADNFFVTCDLISEMQKEFFLNHKIIVPRFNGKNQNPVIFPYKYKSELLKIEGDHGGKSIIRSHLDDVSYVEIKKNSYFDIDTKSDWEIFSKLAQKNWLLPSIFLNADFYTI